MKILITGACGFVGGSLIQAIKQAGLDWSLTGLDNLTRPGSEGNRAELRRLGVKLVHGDLRCQSDVDALPDVDWIIDCAANPSVLAGADGQTSSRQLMEHNLLGTVNMLELCKRAKAGFILLSTSRVYAIEPLASLPVAVQNGAFQPVVSATLPPGVTASGIAEEFSTTAPISLYGASKLASEALALEYGATFDFPVWINRCGVMAGAGQFGRPDQGIFAYWLNCHLRRQPLRYIAICCPCCKSNSPPAARPRNPGSSMSPGDWPLPCPCANCTPGATTGSAPMRWRAIHVRAVSTCPGSCSILRAPKPPGTGSLPLPRRPCWRKLPSMPRLIPTGSASPPPIKPLAHSTTHA